MGESIRNLASILRSFLILSSGAFRKNQGQWRRKKVVLGSLRFWEIEVSFNWWVTTEPNSLIYNTLSLKSSEIHSLLLDSSLAHLAVRRYTWLYSVMCMSHQFPPYTPQDTLYTYGQRGDRKFSDVQVEYNLMAFLDS